MALNPEDLNYFTQGRRRINDAYQIGLGQNQYQQESVRNAYGRQQGDLVQRFAQMRDRVPAGFTRRGMLNSGMAQRAWGDFKQQREKSYADLAGQRDDQLAGLTLARNQLETTRWGAEKDIDEQKAARELALQAASSTLRAAGIGY